jgi:hypothetical protein
MSNQQPPQQADPTAKKGVGFALMPFAPWLIVVLIALSQNKGFEKISQAQNAIASNPQSQADKRLALKECYAKLGVGARGIDEAPEQEVNNALYDCNKKLKEQS